jgi:hypothetical protein
MTRGKNPTTPTCISARSGKLIINTPAMTTVHLAHRGTPGHAAQLMRTIIGRDDRARTAHQTAADTPAELLPDQVASLIGEDHQAVTRRWAAHQKTQRQQRDRALHRQLACTAAAARGVSEIRDTTSASNHDRSTRLMSTGSLS